MEPVDAESCYLSELRSVGIAFLTIAFLNQTEVEKLQVDGFGVVMFRESFSHGSSHLLLVLLAGLALSKIRILYFGVSRT